MMNRKTKALLLAIVLFSIFTSCQQSGNIKKLEVAITKNDNKKVEKVLQNHPSLYENEYKQLCQLSIDNKNLVIPLMLISNGMSPNIYISDMPLSFYYVEFGTDIEFSEFLENDIDLSLTDNKEYRNILNYSIFHDKKEFFIILLKKLFDKQTEISFIHQRLGTLKYCIVMQKFDYANIIIENVNFSEKTRYDCLEYLQALVSNNVPTNITSLFLDKNINMLITSEGFIDYVVYNYSYLQTCDFDIFNCDFIINSAIDGELFLQGEPDGILWLLDFIDCKRKYDFNGKQQTIEEIINYRIKLLSGVIDGDKEMQTKNKEMIEQLQQVIEAINKID